MALMIVFVKLQIFNPGLDSRILYTSPVKIELNHLIIP
jgi:hypothetical protein